MAGVLAAPELSRAEKILVHDEGSMLRAADLGFAGTRVPLAASGVGSR